MGQHDSWDFLTNLISDNIHNYEELLKKAPYFVKTKKHPERPNLIMFNYHPFKSDFSDPIVRCCRGSVYNIGHNGAVAPLLTPFFKFTGYAEKGEDNIDWENFIMVTEKLDGSLLKLLKEHDGNDLWTTNRGFDLNIKIPQNYPVFTEETQLPPYTFKSLLDYALQGHENEIKNLPKNWTFMFELTSPFNRIIIPYPTTELWLLGGRDENHVEYKAEQIKEMFDLNFKIPQKYYFNNMNEVVTFCDSINFEGFVIQDKHFNRIKIKCEHYENLHKTNIRSKLFIKKQHKFKKRQS